MSERKYYCYCDSNCKFETMTKEQILAAIAQAAETGLVVDPDAGFIAKVKEQNAAGNVTFWVGTQAQYNALTSTEVNCLYIITDDNTEAELNELLAEIQKFYDKADDALPRTGGTMSGALTVNGVILTEGVDYGTELPAAGTKGRLFFKVVE